MSSGTILITKKKGLLDSFATRLRADGFRTEFNSNSICVSEVVDNVNNGEPSFTNRLFIGDLMELLPDDGFGEEEMSIYRKLLGDFTGELTGYYIKHHGPSLVARVLKSIADRADIVIDNDHGIIEREDRFVAV